MTTSTRTTTTETAKAMTMTKPMMTLTMRNNYDDDCAFTLVHNAHWVD